MPVYRLGLQGTSYVLTYSTIHVLYCEWIYLSRDEVHRIMSRSRPWSQRQASLNCMVPKCDAEYQSSHFSGHVEGGQQRLVFRLGGFLHLHLVSGAWRDWHLPWVVGIFPILKAWLPCQQQRIKPFLNDEIAHVERSTRSSQWGGISTSDW